MKKINLILTTILLSGVLNAQYSKEKQTEYIKNLASDEFEGRGFGSKGGKKAADYIAAVFKENQLKPCVGDSYLIPFELNDKTGYNVCGMKPGNSQDIVAFGAHFDHVGLSENTADKVFNGADDNASGTSAVMALSDYFKDQNSNSTLMFLAFDAEEVGLIGSGKLLENTDFEYYIPNINVMYNLEMIGTVSEFGTNKVYMTGSDRSNLIQLMNENASSDFKVEDDPYLKHNLFMRSDNVHFFKKGIVSHSLSSVDMSKAKHYHQLHDELSVIDFENLFMITEGIGNTVNKMIEKNNKPAYNK